MEILLWLLPAAVVTLAASVGVAWWGRESRGRDVADREAAARRLGEALARAERRLPGYAAERRTPDRSSGIALRPSKTRPVVIPGEGEVVAKQAEDPTPAETRSEVADAAGTSHKDRRAS
ncbi:MAG TPA: hypothetical protein VNS81_08590 [Nocardioides sp.]|nr:hypothetical protein [Nocardioides sp.]